MQISYSEFVIRATVLLDFYVSENATHSHRCLDSSEEMMGWGQGSPPSFRVNDCMRLTKYIHAQEVEIGGV
jgi:hypothetical protein